ncbi:aspartate carbamoyltransferase catalytic subunit [Primorskyibacter aestuariivivens]|uniref:aspartate carbamoyltransferase catalytic subunit n=1 Tax=Primorskyibacter aestuariivivens TaxID=1888912 RepID=UPI002300E806|nr:aspartate carbamoyltransferase catalytic subunit [Primorskyibacter aestuariivivens]MDA7429996.1 aspartate carbamoyltransferase catalytic subunit [Primorskyibacter aestuariivivens]
MSAATGWEGILHEGETILWQGRPDGAFHLTGARIAEGVFGLFFAGFALVWMMLAANGPGPMWMFGLIHFSVGVGVAFHGFYWPTFLRRRTWYTLTTDRAFIATDLPIKGKSLKSYPVTSDTALSLEDGDPGSIWFAHEFKRTKNGSHRVNIGFERINAAREVLKLMTGIQRGQDAGTQ